MTTDDLRTRAREAAEEYAPLNVGLVGADDMRSHSAFYDGYRSGYLAHAAQQPSREEVAQALAVAAVHHPDLCDCGQPACGGVCEAEGGDCFCETQRCDGLEQQIDAVLRLLNGDDDDAR